MAAHARAVTQRLHSAGIELPRDREAALAAFVGLLSRWNRVFNLTGLHDVGAIVDRHLVESLSLRPLLQGTRIADVGTGAGLPGIPLAVAEPSRQFTLIESRAKRVRFLRHVSAELKLANVEVVHGRAEHLRPDRPFATVLARAVAPPPELLAVCRPLTAPGSILLILTAAHRQAAFAGLAPDFVLRPVEAAAGGTVRFGVRPQSSIVRLERIEDRAAAAAEPA